MSKWVRGGNINITMIYLSERQTITVKKERRRMIKKTYTSAHTRTLSSSVSEGCSVS